MPKRPEVDAWFKTSDHPLKPALVRVRAIVLAADKRMDECIKWKSPTFTFEGNMASLNPNTKKFVSLMFHTGASLPGRHPRLEGGGGTVRYMKFADLAEVKKAEPDLKRAVAAWCASRGEGATKKVAKKKATKKKTAKKTKKKKKKTKKKVAKKRKTAKKG